MNYIDQFTDNILRYLEARDAALFRLQLETDRRYLAQMFGPGVSIDPSLPPWSQGGEGNL